MGVISDFVIARHDEVNKLVQDINSDDFVFKEVRGVQLGELVALFSILEGSSVSEDMYELFPLVSAKDEDDGPWAYAIPDALVSLLSQIQDEQISEIAKAWRSNEAAALIDRTPFEVLEGYLKSLKSLSLSAVEERKCLYCRVCL